MKNLKRTLADFGVTFQELKSRERNGEQIEQNHFGDCLMIQENEDNERYNVWVAIPENVSLGEPEWTIEYCGKQNRWTWETIATNND